MDWIVTLVLPGAAAGIASTEGSSALPDLFTSLKKISGTNIKSIAGWTFSGCTGLTDASFPAAASIGERAFSGCTGLTAVSLPAAVSVGVYAFSGCTRLTAVDLPAATSIGGYAFPGCTGLTAVGLPAAVTIGAGAFFGCTGLTSVSLPAATSIGSSTFANTGGIDLTITLGSSAPVLQTVSGSDSTKMFYGVDSLKRVTVQTPQKCSDYDGWDKEKFRDGNEKVQVTVNKI